MGRVSVTKGDNELRGQYARGGYQQQRQPHPGRAARRGSGIRRSRARRRAAGATTGSPARRRTGPDKPDNRAAPGHASRQSTRTAGRAAPLAGREVEPAAGRRQSPGLSAHNLGKSFKKRPVLRAVNVSVQRGEAVGLLGPNGAGKTTCFYIITGLIRPDVGTITLDGEDITDLPMYRRARLGIGYLPQEASIFRGLTVEQNIRAVLEVAEPVPETREPHARRAVGRILDHPSAPRAGDGAVGRRAAARRDRPRAGDASAFHPARRAAWPASTRSRSATSATWWRI